MNKLLIYLSLIFVVNNSCFAGNQQYEELQASTKQMMEASIADNKPILNSFENEDVKLNWLKKTGLKLNKKFTDENELMDFLISVHYESTRAGLDPELVLGLIKVESDFLKYAISSVGARGFMQIMPFWVDVIGDKSHNLFQLRTNLRYGCTILRYYVLKENGNIANGLARYNGSLGKDTYPNAVLKAMKEFKD